MTDRPMQANPRGQVEVGRRLGPHPSRPTIAPKPAERMESPRRCCWKGWVWPWHRCKEGKR